MNTKRKINLAVWTFITLPINIAAASFWKQTCACGEKSIVVGVLFYTALCAALCWAIDFGLRDNDKSGGSLKTR